MQYQKIPMTQNDSKDSYRSQKKYQKIQNDSKRFQTTQKDSQMTQKGSQTTQIKRFQTTQKDIKRFQTTQKDSQTFQMSQKNSNGFKRQVWTNLDVENHTRLLKWINGDKSSFSFAMWQIVLKSLFKNLYCHIFLTIYFEIKVKDQF